MVPADSISLLLFLSFLSLIFLSKTLETDGDIPCVSLPPPALLLQSQIQKAFWVHAHQYFWSILDFICFNLLNPNKCVHGECQVQKQKAFLLSFRKCIDWHYRLERLQKVSERIFFSVSQYRKIWFRALIYRINASFVENESADEVKSSTSSTYSDHPPTLALSSSSDNLMSSKSALIHAYFYLRNRNWPIFRISRWGHPCLRQLHEGTWLLLTYSYFLKDCNFRYSLARQEGLFCAGCKWVEGSATMGLWSGSVCWHADYFRLH